MRNPVHMLTARIGHALASPVRLRALSLLAQRPWPVGELAAELGESPASASAHLKVLRAACLVADEKRGREVWCRLAGDEVMDLLLAAQRAAEALLPDLRELVRQADDDPHALPRFDLRELADDLAHGRVTLIDLRPEPEFRAGHLPGARSLPFHTLSRADLAALKPRRRVVAYCRGPWCLMARQGVQALNDRGIPARRLRAGVAEWRAAGLHLERDDHDLSAAQPPAPGRRSKPRSPRTKESDR